MHKDNFDIWVSKMKLHLKGLFHTDVGYLTTNYIHLTINSTIDDREEALFCSPIAINSP